MTECRQKLYQEGKPAPRTCAECGLGPCKYQIGVNGQVTPYLAPPVQESILISKDNFNKILEIARKYMKSESCNNQNYTLWQNDRDIMADAERILNGQSNPTLYK